MDEEFKQVRRKGRNTAGYTTKKLAEAQVAIEFAQSLSAKVSATRDDVRQARDELAEVRRRHGRSHRALDPR